MGLCMLLYDMLAGKLHGVDVKRIIAYGDQMSAIQGDCPVTKASGLSLVFRLYPERGPRGQSTYLVACQK